MGLYNVFFCDLVMAEEETIHTGTFHFFGLHVNQSTNGYIWGSVRHHDEDDKSPMIHLLT